MIAVIMLLVAGCTSALTLCSQRPEGDPSAPMPLSSGVLEITIGSARAGRVVYLEHVGPYWTVGPVLARLQEHMLEHKQQGSTFIRYLDNPGTTAPDKLRTEIGYFVTDNYQPKAPYRSAVRPSQVVATMLMREAISTPPRSEAAIRRWAVARGHTPLGSISEILPGAKDSGTTGGPIEVQMAIRPTTSQQVPSIRAVRPGEVRLMPPMSAGGPGRGSATTLEGSTTDYKKPDREPAPPMTSATQVPAGSIESFRELARQERFVRIAELLMPSERLFPPALQLWFGQVVFRIGAVARGIAQVYPQERSTAAALASAIRLRYDVVSADFTLDARDQPVLRVDPQSDRHAAQKREIMRELDAMLGGIAVTRVSAKEAERKLIDIGQRVYDLVSAERSKVFGRESE